MNIDDAAVVRAKHANVRRSVRSGIVIAGESNADRVPDDVGPVRAGPRVTVFVAEQTRAVPHAARVAPLLERNR